MRYFHRRTVLGAVVKWRWATRRFHRHLIKHRHTYVSGGMIHVALIVFVGDAVVATTPLPHVIIVIFEAQKHWAVPIAAAVGHVGFMLEREADKMKAEAKAEAAHRAIHYNMGA